MLWAASGQKRFLLCATYLVAAGMLAGCAPVIHVENNTRLTVRAWVAQYGGVQHVKGRYRNKIRTDPEGVSVGRVWDRFAPGIKRLDIYDTLRIPPGGGGSVVAVEGKYHVAVWTEDVWVSQLKAFRSDLETILKDPSSLAKEQIAALTQRLVNLVPDMEDDQRLDAFCNGTVGNSEEDVNAKITLAGSSLNVTCSSTVKSPKR